MKTFNIFRKVDHSLEILYQIAALKDYVRRKGGINFGDLLGMGND